MMTSMTENIENLCSPNFKYSDFIKCSDTYKVVEARNIPEQHLTYFFIKQLANDILEPCLKKFGRLKLTYGFCDQTLAREIKKRSGGIYPPLDQHAGMEFKKNGSLVSPRGGFASDFHCLPTPSLDVAKYVVKELKFDRLYYYGTDRPVHVSVNEKPVGKIVIMQKAVERTIPKQVSQRAFLNI